MLIRPVLSNGDLALPPPIPPGFGGGLAAIIFACPSPHALVEFSKRKKKLGEKEKTRDWKAIVFNDPCGSTLFVSMYIYYA
jgi:hypothetical protein